MMRYLLVLVLFLCAAEAAAQSCSHSYTLNSDSCPDQGAAYAAVWAAANEQVAKYKEVLPTDTRTACFNATDATGVTIWIKINGCGSANHKLYTRTFPAGKDCKSRPPLGPGVARIAEGASTGAVCDNGCEMADPTGTFGVTLNPGTPEAATYATTTGAKPTGELCLGTDIPPMLSDTECTKVGNLTQCMRPDGRHCAQASTGKMFCWEPNEAGTRVSGNEGATKTPEGKTPNPPPIPPANNGNWESTTTGGTTVNNNGSTTNYTTTNYTSSNGTQGSGGGATNPDGSDDGGGDGDGDGPGSAGDGVGDLYDGNGDKTVASVFAAFRSRVSDSALISAIDGFFTVSGGGACPVFSVEASDYWDAMTYDGHCTGTIATVLTYMGWVLLAAAAIAAAVWALS